MDYKEMIDVRQRMRGMNRHVGVRVVEITEGGAVAELDLTPQTLNPLGNAHGGAIFTLCDSAAGSAAAARGRIAVTLSGSINYLRPGRAGKTLRAVASELKSGRNTAVYTVDVYDTDGTLVSNCTFTMFYTGQTVDEVWAAD
ncbi:PaaI family thioesterase [Intestinibacillus massiliensis]|nr:PaaI family thioesterase [Intestinibacillus massiliensis]